MLVLSLLLWCVFAASGQQVHFFLRNGDRLTGSVVAEDPSGVTVSNAWLGRFLIPAAQIERRQAVEPAGAGAGAGALAARPAPAPPPRPGPALTKEQQLKLDGLVQVYMAGQLSSGEFQRRREAILSPKPAGPKRWSGDLLVGIDLGQGTKNRQSFTGRAKINYTEKRFRNSLDYLFTYGHIEGELAANRMDATDKADLDLDALYYLYALGGTGYDEIRKIDYYLQAGPGFGQHLIKRTNFVLNAEVGANYQMQNFQGGRDTFLFYYRFAQDLRWTISSKFHLDQKVEYTPQWDHLAQFKVRAEANLRYWLLDNFLSLNLTVIDLYDTRVARGISRNDLQIRSSIGVRF